MLCKEDELLVAVAIATQDLSELLELGLLAKVIDLAREVTETLDLLALGLEFSERHGDDSSERLLFGGFVLLALTYGRFFIGRSLIKDILDVETLLVAVQLLQGDAPLPHVLDECVQSLDASLERAQESERGAREPPLEDAHGQAGGGPVQDSGAVVIRAHVVGSPVVQRLFAVLALGQVVAEGVGDARRVERRPVEPNHLLLGSSREVPLPCLRGKGVEGFERGEGLGLQQAPKAVVGKILAHVGSGREQHQMVGAPLEAPSGITIGQPSESLSQLVAIGLADPEVGLAAGG